MYSDLIEGDPQHTSTRLRKKAVEILSTSRRPMAGHEIETWIRMHEPDLWGEVAEKCPDYTRIILSLTKGNVITKFKSLKVIKGIDRRAVFYGLNGENYSPKDWQPVDDSKHVRQEAPRVIDIPTPQMSAIDLETVKDSWMRLSTLLPMKSSTWTDLLRGISIIDDRIQDRLDVSGTVREIISETPSLQDPQIVQDVQNIFFREIEVKSDQMKGIINPTLL